MKCPKCGFVSFPGLDQCKKCGHPFTAAESPASNVPPLFRQTSEHANHPDSSRDDWKELGSPIGSVSLNDSRERSPESPAPVREETATRSSAPLDWQKELAERMQEFRRRRARISTGKEDAGPSRSLDFNPPLPTPNAAEPQPNVIEFPSFDEVNLQQETPGDPDADLESFTLEPPREQTDRREATSRGAGLFHSQPSAPPVPMEIEMESSSVSADEIGAGDAAGPRVASLRQRFLAGFFDLAVLLAGGGVFALIFREAGGRLPTLPLSLAMMVLVGGLFLLAYFGAFMVFAHGTPGLIWGGLEIRTFAGNLPKRSDYLWRTFGYLVSASALLLGFIWALVDGDGLTWHDRMSRTLLVDAQGGEAHPAATAL